MESAMAKMLDEYSHLRTPIEREVWLRGLGGGPNELATIASQDRKLAGGGHSKRNNSTIPLQQTPSFPSLRQTPSVLSAAQTPSGVPAEQTPSVLPSAQTPSGVSAEQTPTVLFAAQTPSGVPAEQTPSILPSAQTPTCVSAEQTPTVLSAAQTPTGLPAEQTPSVSSGAQIASGVPTEQTQSCLSSRLGFGGRFAERLTFRAVKPPPRCLLDTPHWDDSTGATEAWCEFHQRAGTRSEWCKFHFPLQCSPCEQWDAHRPTRMTPSSSEVAMASNQSEVEAVSAAGSCMTDAAQVADHEIGT